jgi:hypothetical protein
MGTSDDMESNVSSFLQEMKETAYILDHATSRSLVFLDELGRRCVRAVPAPHALDPSATQLPGIAGANIAARVPAPLTLPPHSTSNEDGVGIAWAVCEHFISKRIPAVFITFYHQLAVGHTVTLVTSRSAVPLAASVAILRDPPASAFTFFVRRHRRWRRCTAAS